MFGWSGWQSNCLRKSRVGTERLVDNIRPKRHNGGTLLRQDGVGTQCVARSQHPGRQRPVICTTSMRWKHLICFDAVQRNRSTLNSPNESSATSLTVQWPNGTQQSQEFAAFNGYLTRGTKEAGIKAKLKPTRAIREKHRQPIGSGRPQLVMEPVRMGRGRGAMELATVGMEGMIEPTHLARPTTPMPATSPPSQQTNGDGGAERHGWEMGAARQNLHVRRRLYIEDDKLSCVSETTENYNVGHSTITLILNEDLEPTVAWTGDEALKTSPGCS